MAANFEDLKKIIKNPFLSESKNSFGNVIASCVDLDEKILKKFVMSTLSSKKEQEK